MSTINTKTLDHIVHLTPPGSVEEASRQFRELGFTVLPGGTHADGLTANALVVLADGVYLELISFTHPLSHYPKGSPPYMLRKNHRWAHTVPGWIDFAFLGNGILNGDGKISELINSRGKEEHSGVLYKNEVEGGRVRAGDGKVLKWVISAPDPQSLGGKQNGDVGTLPFFCGDVTPREWRVPSEPPSNTRHPAGAVGVAYVKILFASGSSNAGEFQNLAKKITSVVGHSPIADQGPNEYVWRLDTPNSVHDAARRPVPPAKLIATVPKDDDELGFATSWATTEEQELALPNPLAGVYEIGFWVEKRPDGAEVVKTPFGRLRWVEIP